MMQATKKGPGSWTKLPTDIGSNRQQMAGALGMKGKTIATPFSSTKKGK
jgi:hypothetical protein